VFLSLRALSSKFVDFADAGVEVNLLSCVCARIGRGLLTCGEFKRAEESPATVTGGEGCADLWTDFLREDPYLRSWRDRSRSYELKVRSGLKAAPVATHWKKAGRRSLVGARILPFDSLMLDSPFSPDRRAANWFREVWRVGRCVPGWFECAS